MFQNGEFQTCCRRFLYLCLFTLLSPEKILPRQNCNISLPYLPVFYLEVTRLGIMIEERVWIHLFKEKLMFQCKTSHVACLGRHVCITIENSCMIYLNRSVLTKFVYFYLHILRYSYLKDLQSVFGREQQRYLESQLQKYRRVVGPVLSERMVYSLG